MGDSGQALWIRSSAGSDGELMDVEPVDLEAGISECQKVTSINNEENRSPNVTDLKQRPSKNGGGGP